MDAEIQSYIEEGAVGIYICKGSESFEKALIEISNSVSRLPVLSSAKKLKSKVVAHFTKDNNSAGETQALDCEKSVVNKWDAVDNTFFINSTGGGGGSCDCQLLLVVAPSGSLSRGGRGTRPQVSALHSALKASTLRWINSVDSLQPAHCNCQRRALIRSHLQRIHRGRKGDVGSTSDCAGSVEPDHAEDSSRIARAGNLASFVGRCSSCV